MSGVLIASFLFIFDNLSHEIAALISESMYAIANGPDDLKKKAYPIYLIVEILPQTLQINLSSNQETTRNGVCLAKDWAPGSRNGFPGSILDIGRWTTIRPKSNGSFVLAKARATIICPPYYCQSVENERLVQSLWKAERMIGDCCGTIEPRRTIS